MSDEKMDDEKMNDGKPVEPSASFKSIELVYEMVRRGLIPNEAGAMNHQVNELMNFNDETFENLKKIVKESKVIIHGNTEIAPSISSEDQTVPSESFSEYRARLRELLCEKHNNFFQSDRKQPSLKPIYDETFIKGANWIDQLGLTDTYPNEIENVSKKLSDDKEEALKEKFSDLLKQKIQQSGYANTNNRIMHEKFSDWRSAYQGDQVDNPKYLQLQDYLDKKINFFNHQYKLMEIENNYSPDKETLLRLSTKVCLAAKTAYQQHPLTILLQNGALDETYFQPKLTQSLPQEDPDKIPLHVLRSRYLTDQMVKFGEVGMIRRSSRDALGPLFLAPEEKINSAQEDLTNMAQCQDETSPQGGEALSALFSTPEDK